MDDERRRELLRESIRRLLAAQRGAPQRDPKPTLMQQLAGVPAQVGLRQSPALDQTVEAMEAGRLASALRGGDPAEAIQSEMGDFAAGIYRKALERMAGGH